MSLRLMVLLAAVSLTTCDDDPGAAGPTPPRAVRTMVVDQGGADAYRTLPGVLTAAETMRLAFPVSGRLIEVPLRAGDRMVEGEQIARLDPAEITREITAAEANCLRRLRVLMQRMPSFSGSGRFSSVVLSRAPGSSVSLRSFLLRWLTGAWPRPSLPPRATGWTASP